MPPVRAGPGTGRGRSGFFLLERDDAPGPPRADGMAATRRRPSNGFSVSPTSAGATISPWLIRPISVSEPVSGDEPCFAEEYEPAAIDAQTLLRLITGSDDRREDAPRQPARTCQSSEAMRTAASGNGRSSFVETEAESLHSLTDRILTNASSQDRDPRDSSVAHAHRSRR